MEWRFAQVSDLRLGAMLTNFDGDVASALRTSSRDALGECLSIAQSEYSSTVLVVGDLFVLKGLDPAVQLRFIYARMADFPGLEFIITPGNSDAFESTEPYSFVPPPSNVKLIHSSEWTTIDLPLATVTGRALCIGESTELDVSTLPTPDPSKPAVLMARGVVKGADDGIARRNPVRIDVDRILDVGYSYIALGGLFAQIELRGEQGRAIAAYAGTPQSLTWGTRGPSGFLTGSLDKDGAEIKFHHTERSHWKERQIDLPLPYEESYASKLRAALHGISDGLGENDLVKLTLTGELHQSQREELEQLLAAASDSAEYFEANSEALRYFSGLNPADMPQDSLFANFLQRCSAQAAHAGTDQEAYDLARRLGWLLFTGKGLPSEITE